MEKTPRITIKSTAQRWKYQYFTVHGDRWSSTVKGCAQKTHDDILKCKTLDQVDKVIGNSSWTHNMCSNCYETSRDIMLSTEVNGGEYQMLFCRSCLKKALKILGEN